MDRVAAVNCAEANLSLEMTGGADVAVTGRCVLRVVLCRGRRGSMCELVCAWTELRSHDTDRSHGGLGGEGARKERCDRRIELVRIARQRSKPSPGGREMWREERGRLELRFGRQEGRKVGRYLGTTRVCILHPASCVRPRKCATRSRGTAGSGPVI